MIFLKKNVVEFGLPFPLTPSYAGWLMGESLLRFERGVYMRALRVVRAVEICFGLAATPIVERSCTWSVPKGVHADITFFHSIAHVLRLSCQSRHPFAQQHSRETVSVLRLL